MFLPGRYRRRFHELYKRGNGEAAASLARRYTKSFPNDAMGWRDLGAASMLIRDYATAEMAFGRALEISPDPRMTQTLANTLARTGRSAKAAELLRPLLASDDVATRCWAYLGLAQVAVEDHAWDEAMQHGREAQDLLTAESDLELLELATCVASIPGQEEWAERLARQGIEQENPAAYLLLALLVEHRDPYEAADYLSAARKRWPGPPRELDRLLPGLRAERKRLRTIEAQDP